MDMVKTRGSALRPKLISIAVASCFVTGTALANPTGANVVRGTAAIHQAGNLLQITNSPNAIINWQTFSIGANEITRFIQQSSSSAVLNRVTTQDPSVILGTLQSRLANGQVGGKVFLINPNGILFGKGSKVDVGGLVASSLNLSNADFVAGRHRFTETPGAKPVINDGSIRTSQGGSVFLVGPDVTNGGVITTPGGAAVLAAGKSVELVDPGTPNLRVEVVAEENQATNLGQIVADAGRVGIYAGLIRNAGTIRADSAVSQGGRILLKASKSVTLEDSSVLSAKGKGGGRIEVLAEDSVRVAGTLDASAPNGGNGGFIETSATEVRVEAGTVATTAAAKGKAGTWLIDPTNFAVAAGTAPQTASGIGADTLSGNLQNGSVTIATAAAGVEPGGITVDAAVTWDAATSLTLIAHSNVVANAAVTGTNANSGLNLYAGWNGTSPTTAPVVQCCGQIGVNAPITAGNIKLVAGFFITQTSSGVITANTLMASAPSVSLSADFNGARNMVNVLAGNATDGSFRFFNAKPLTIGTASGVSGITATQNNGSATIEVVVDGGNLTVNRNVTAIAGTSVEGAGQANIMLATRTTGSIIVQNGAVISAVGAEGPGQFGSGGSASVELNTAAQSGGSITVAGASHIEARGGNAGGSGSGGDGRVTLIADGAITVDGSTLIARGGVGGGVEAQGGFADVSLSAGTGPVVVRNQSTLQAFGGAGGSSGGGSANISLSGTGINVAASTISATGGAPGTGSSGGYASVNIQGNSAPVSISGSTITATSGLAALSGAYVSVGSSSDVTVSSSTISIDGSEGGININGNNVTVTNSTLTSSTDGTACCSGSFVGISSSGATVVSNSTLTATGPDGAEVGVSGGGAVSVSNSTLTATGPDGAEGSIFGASVNTASSTITARGTGPEPLPPSIDIFASSGGVVLGSLVAVNGNVSVNASAGAITDGNGAANNIQTTSASLFGSTGVGTMAKPLDTMVQQINLFGGSGPVAIMNTGNLVLHNLSTSGAAMIETTGLLRSGTSGVSASGNLTLISNGMHINRFTSSGGDLTLNAGFGDLDIVADGGESVFVQGNNVFLMGGNVNVAAGAQGLIAFPTTVSANNLLSVMATGNVMVTAGNVSGANARMMGGVDVDMTIGGTLALNGNLTAGTVATVEAGTPQTIKLTFSGLSADGFSVNGKLNAIEDNGSGFFVLGSPAILDENMFVTYGGPPPFTDILTATMNQQADVLADQLKAGDTGQSGEEKEKKKLPFCDG